MIYPLEYLKFTQKCQKKGSFLSCIDNYSSVNLAIKRIKIQILLIFLLGFIFFIPNVNCIKDTVYLEYQDSTPIYSLEASEGNLILWEFRTYDNPFICELRCLETPVFVSWDKTSDKGVLEVLESNTYRFRFDNIGQHPPQDGYLEFEIKIIQRIPGYNFLIILSIISFISLISIASIKLKKKMRVD